MQSSQTDGTMISSLLHDGFGKTQKSPPYNSLFMIWAMILQSMILVLADHTLQTSQPSKSTIELQNFWELFFDKDLYLQTKRERERGRVRGESTGDKANSNRIGCAIYVELRSVAGLWKEIQSISQSISDDEILKHSSTTLDGGF